MKSSTKTTLILTASILTVLAADPAGAAIIDFDLIGTGGPGLHFLSEPGVSSGGTGGEIGAGIFYDDVTKFLTLNVGWGVDHGFTNLTGLVTNRHIHGPTASVNGNGFTQTASPAPFNNMALTTNTLTGGSSVNSTTAALSALQETQLMEGRFYINLHTAANPGGEVRGFLVVPEPSSALLLLGSVVPLLMRRRRASV